ncbi:uncharacterized protein EAF01_001004 [Botrytis porri]|uniref:uncharacterized protein n=1 Tax=Botrytis porri TaxID=87229 RepID=UPI001901BCA2|nr:uncharacterized protein EAF01_001004 [Botrytis porri]KAF7914598.1 hypothetical protein EAF01_001004 [Botrytis porri]
MMVQTFVTLLSLFVCVNSALIPAQLLNRDDPSPVIAPAPSIPSCAIPCIASAVAAETSCGATDLACRCDPGNASLIQGVATGCVLQACGIQEALQVLDDATAECSSVLAAGNAGAASSSAAPSAITSAAPTSAPTSLLAAPSSVPTTSPIDPSPPFAVPSSVAGSLPSSVPNTSSNATFIIPACADSCIQNAIGSTPCGLTNITCQCEKSNAETIQAATVYCIAANCGENGDSVAIEINRSQVDNCTALTTPYNSSSSITGSVTANGPTQISLTGNPSGISTALPPCGPPIPGYSAAPTDPGSVGTGPSYYGYPTLSNPINPPGSPTSGAGDPPGIASSTPTDPGSASSTNISVDPSGGSGSIPTDPSSPTSGGSFPSGAGSSTPTDPGSASSTNASADPSGIISSTPTDPGSASSTSVTADPSGGSGSIATDSSSPANGGSFPSGGSTPVDPGSTPTDPSSPTSSGFLPSGGSTPVDPGLASSTNASADPSGTSGSSSTIPSSLPSDSSSTPTDPSGGIDPPGAASSTYPSDPSGTSSTPPSGNGGPSYGYGYGYGSYYPSSIPTPTGNGGDSSDPSGSGGVSASSSATGAISSSSQSIGASTTSEGDSSSPSTSAGDPSSPTIPSGDPSSPSRTGGDPSPPSPTNSDPSSPTASSGLNDPSGSPSGTDPSSSTPSNSNNPAPPPPPPPPASGGYYGYNPASSPTFTSPSIPAIPTSSTDPTSAPFRLSLLPSRYSLLTYIMRVYFNLSPPSPFISARGLTTNFRDSACIFSISSSGLLSCSGSSSSSSHSHSGNPDTNTRYFGEEFARVWDSGYTVLQTRNSLRDMRGKDLNGSLVVDSTSEYPYGNLLKLRNGEFIGNDNQARFCAQISSPIPPTYGSPNPYATQSQTDAFLEGSPVRAYINGTQGLPTDCQEVKLVIEWVDGGA